MSTLQIWLIVGIFTGVILLIAFDILDMTVAALLGVCLLFAFGLLERSDLQEASKVAGGPLALLLADVGTRDVVLRTRHHPRLAGTDRSGMRVGILHGCLRGWSLSSIVQKPLV